MSETWDKLDDILGRYRIFGTDCDRLKLIIRKRILVGFLLGFLVGLWVIGWPLLVVLWGIW